MSLTTAGGRRSAVSVNRVFRPKPIIPSGSLEQADRQTIGWGYFGILVGVIKSFTGFKDTLFNDFQDIFLRNDEFAEEIVYNRNGIGMVSINAQIFNDGLAEELDPTSKNFMATLRVYISCDNTDGIPSIDLNDTMTYMGNTYKLDDILNQDEYSFQLLFIRINPKERQRNNRQIGP